MQIRNQTIEIELFPLLERVFMALELLIVGWLMLTTCKAEHSLSVQSSSDRTPCLHCLPDSLLRSRTLQMHFLLLSHYRCRRRIDVLSNPKVKLTEAEEKGGKSVPVQ